MRAFDLEWLLQGHTLPSVGPSLTLAPHAASVMRQCFASKGSTTLLTRGERPGISSSSGHSHPQRLGQNQLTHKVTQRTEYLRQSLRAQASAWEGKLQP